MEISRITTYAMKKYISIKYLLPILVLALSACETHQSVIEGAVSNPTPVNPPLKILVLSNPQVIDNSVRDPDQQRLIADILFEALQAMDSDRLLTPVDNNAYAKFQRALAYDPRNEIALEGLQKIVERYLKLSAEANRRGLFEESQALLDSAKFVDDAHPGLEAATEALLAEMNSGDLFFQLNAQDFSKRSESAVQQLTDIAHQARQHEAFFLITAPNDDQARWMFSVMRNAIEGYRLRGNIELASRTTIRLRISAD
jgi:hypothetical protein